MTVPLPKQHRDSADRRPVAGYLLPSERCLAVTHRHPMRLWKPILACYLAMLLYVFIWLSVTSSHHPALKVATFLVGAAGCWLLWSVADWRTERFVVTDKRMILTSGVVTKRVAMMPLAKVTDMTFERPPIGRLVGYGTFVMESAGQDQALSRVAYVPNCQALYLQVADLLFGRR